MDGRPLQRHGEALLLALTPRRAFWNSGANQGPGSRDSPLQDSQGAHDEISFASIPPVLSCRCRCPHPSTRHCTFPLCVQPLCPLPPHPAEDWAPAASPTIPSQVSFNLSISPPRDRHFISQGDSPCVAFNHGRIWPMSFPFEATATACAGAPPFQVPRGVRWPLVP